MTSDRFQGERGICFGQRMTPGHQHTAPPAITGQRNQTIEVHERLSGDGQINLAARGELGDLPGRALLQGEADTGPSPHEELNDRRQDIARLSMRGGDRQGAMLGITALLGDATDVFGLGEDALGLIDHLSTQRGECDELLAPAHEQGRTQFRLELADLPAQCRLRGKQALGRLGDIESAADDFQDGS